ncbi:tyrosine-type recombinase/integrase [Pseudochrobactrum sp. XF203]|uniref:tyrosine-type recombinase/integrase n=1 Tax=Pseudochrobactrum sp. XF203 TaxID=2879116 RepID=UPI001CE25ABB|nr:tyrosine-type recombinase/integrase [Pseudochrobactrum sp. XF203]UCA44774.1 tyrosine-type recombinase/integrase [Pseudochrobactrum sp. XF203]
MKYLWKKNNGYFFQHRVPQHLVQTFQKSHFRLWLGDISARDAKRCAYHLASHLQMGFALGADRKALERSLLELQKQYKKVSHEKFWALLRSGMGREDAEHASTDKEREDFLKYSVEQLAASKTYEKVQEQLKTLENALQTDAAALAAEREAYAHALQSVASMNVQPVPAPILVQPPAPTIEMDERIITADTFLSAAGKIILDNRKQAKEGAAKADDRYQERLTTSLAAFIDIVGDKPLSYYLPMHIQDFANVMSKIPKNRSKYECFKGLSLKETAQKNAKRKEPIQVLTASSVQSSISEILNLWSRMTAGVSGVRDLKSYRITMPSAARKNVVREGLPASSLNVWLEDAFAINTVRYEYKKYMLLVGLLTGMRLGEIVYLQPKDIIQYEGHTVIDLRQPIILRGKTIDRALKTETSPRIVALHPYLHECGFVHWALRRRDWIFGEVQKADDPADAASKQMSNWMRKLGIHEPYRQVFHSLRHNAKHWLRNGTNKLIADKQCGHASDSVADSYGFSVLQADEIGLIEALDLPKIDVFLKS